MLKKLIAVIIIILLASGIVFFLIYFFDAKKPPESSALKAIPTSAALIIEAKQSPQTWKKLSESNIIWEELVNVNAVNRIDQAARIIDSIYQQNFRVKEIFDKQPLFISGHINNSSSIEYLFLFNVPPSLGKSTITDAAKEIAGKNYSKERDYDGAVIFTFQPEQSEYDRPFFLCVYHDIFIGSFNEMLVEDAVRQINSGVSLKDNFAFTKIYSTSGEKADLNIFINPDYFYAYLKSLSKAEYHPSLASLKNFSDWTALDLKVKTNILMLNGFSFSNDTSIKFIHLFKNQKPREAGFVEIIPSNTAAFIHFGFTNFNGFYKEFGLYLDNGNRKEKINLAGNECKCDIEKEALAWVENEMAVVINRPPADISSKSDSTGISHSILEDNFFAIFKSNNLSEAKKSLSTLEDSAFEPVVDTVSKNEIRKFRFHSLYKDLLGNLFSPLTSIHYTVIDDYIVLGNDVRSLKYFINSYNSEKTLSKNLNYRSFAENLSSESNIFFYSNFDASFNILNEFLDPGFSEKTNENRETFRKFEAVALQVNTESEQLSYNTLFLKYNPINKRETSTIWETRIDTTISSRPHLVVNHYTGAKEIFVQDDANIMYLISGTGKILWKRLINEKISSDIYQVDALKNNKLQMLFNTDNSVYLIDRNGKDVTGFPIKLKAQASNEIAVFDYDKNKNYRILIACMDGKLYNYEISGQPVKGWEFPPLKSIMKKPISFFTLEGKDYITGIDEEGNIYVVDRMGKNRVNVKEKIKISPANTYFLEPGKNISKTRIISTDSSGTITRLYFNGNIENIKIDDFTEDHFFAYYDINSDQSPEYIFLDKNKLKVFAQDKLRYSLIDFEFDEEISEGPQFFEISGKSAIGICDKGSGKIYLIDGMGNLAEDFPLYGTTLFSIGDLNNGGELHLVTASGNNIYSYLLK